MEDCAGLGSVSMAFGSITAVNCVHASELDKDLATILSDTFALVSDDMRSQRWLHLNLPPSLIDLDALGFPCWSISAAGTCLGLKDRRVKGLVDSYFKSAFLSCCIMCHVLKSHHLVVIVLHGFVFLPNSTFGILPSTHHDCSGGGEERGGEERAITDRAIGA